jgi:transcriptional regulator with XRE-family HTH domain
MENLSLKMNYYKKKLKLTNEQIANLSGIPVQTVATISSGRTKNPSLRTLKSLSKVFNCTLDDLINLTDAKTPVLLDESTVSLVEKMSKSKTIKRLFEIVSNMNEMDIQAVVGLAERLYITSGENYVK